MQVSKPEIGSQAFVLKRMGSCKKNSEPDGKEHGKWNGNMNMGLIWVRCRGRSNSYLVSCSATSTLRESGVGARLA